MSATDFESKRPWKRAVETMSLIAGLIGSVTAIVTAYNEVSVFVFPALQRLLGTAPSDLVISVVPDRASAQVYDRILAEAGLRAKSLTADQIQNLGAEPAGVVIVDGRVQVSASVAGLFSRRPLEITRLIGMGNSGAALISEIDPGTILGPGNLEQERNDPVIFGTPNPPPSLMAGLPTDRPINLYANPPRNESDNVAIYDNHSLPALGAIGIVRRTSVSRFPCAGGYWPIVQQGRFVLWGYKDDLQNLSDEGKRLLVNVIRYLQVDQADKHQLVTQELSQTSPLHYSDKLDCTGKMPVDEQVYPFVIDQPGTIQIKVQSQGRLSLILNGPGQTGFYARKDDVAPEIAYSVTQHDVDRGINWRATVKDFVLKPGSKVPYMITIDFPPHRVRHPFIWIGIGAAGLALFGTVVILSLKRLKLFGLRRS